MPLPFLSRLSRVEVVAMEFEVPLTHIIPYHTPSYNPFPMPISNPFYQSVPSFHSRPRGVATWFIPSHAITVGTGNSNAIFFATAIMTTNETGDDRSDNTSLSQDVTQLHFIPLEFRLTKSRTENRILYSTLHT
jgi:hypothetical protein